MIILYIIICGLIFVAMISCIDINRLVVRDYSMDTDKLDGEVRIAFLSDMHNKEHGTDNYKLITAIRDFAPDLVLVGGDMLTAHKGLGYDIPLKLMDRLKDYPVYYGIGNHEYRMKLYTEDYGDGYEKYLAELKDRGVKVLENESAADCGLLIQGLMIDRVYYKRMSKIKMSADYIEELTGKRDDDSFRILLAHNPEYFYAYSHCADLVLSGHVHGGIMKLPLLGGVISPRLRLFPKYDGGRFDENGSVMIVSRGLGSHTLPIRVFNPAELVTITLHGNKTHKI